MLNNAVIIIICSFSVIKISDLLKIINVEISQLMMQRLAVRITLSVLDSVVCFPVGIIIHFHIVF